MFDTRAGTLQHRDLTWDSIRRGAATMWVNNSGLEQANEQLRHKKPEATKRYAKATTKDRRRVAEDNWATHSERSHHLLRSPRVSATHYDKATKNELMVRQEDYLVDI